MKYSEAKEFARQMRLNPTKAERVLWKRLRKRQLYGKRFLRQHPVFIKQMNSESFYFIPDFFCYEGKLAIELDGNIHNYSQNKDSSRDNILANIGITVLRFNNSELNDIESILEKILKHFAQ